MQKTEIQSKRDITLETHIHTSEIFDFDFVDIQR